MESIVRTFGLVVAGVVISLLLLVAIDAAVWHRAVAAGNGFDSVQVSRVSIATLKGAKEEYYTDGTEAVRCSRSVLPMPAADGWLAPCWWQRRHRTIEVRY